MNEFWIHLSSGRVKHNTVNHALLVLEVYMIDKI